MEIQGSAVFIPFEYISLFCAGAILLLIVGALYVAVRRALAPRSNVEYYNTPSYLPYDSEGR